MNDSLACDTHESARPQGCVLLVRNYVVPVALTANQTRFDIQQIIDSDADWLFRGIQIATTSALNNVRVRLEVNDYFLSNARVPLNVLCYAGYQAKVFEQDIWVERGGRVSIEAAETAGVAFNGAITLLGVKMKERTR